MQVDKKYQESVATAEALIGVISSVACGCKDSEYNPNVRRKDVEHKVATSLRKHLTVHLPAEH